MSQMFAILIVIQDLSLPSDGLYPLALTMNLIKHRRTHIVCAKLYYIIINQLLPLFIRNVNKIHRTFVSATLTSPTEQPKLLSFQRFVYLSRQVEITLSSYKFFFIFRLLPSAFYISICFEQQQIQVCISLYR